MQKTKKECQTMATVGIEQTSNILGNHLTDCTSADVTRTFILSWCDFQNIMSYILHINSRKLHGQNRSGID
jgi:hypothetical protein